MTTCEGSHMKPRLYVIRPTDKANDWRIASMDIYGLRRMAKEASE
jgi:hypothetical protein